MPAAIRKITQKTLFQPPFVCNPSRYFSTQNSNSISDKPSTTYYDDLINKAGRDRDFATVQHLLNKRMRDGCFNTKNTFKFISVDLSVLDDLLQTLARLNEGFPRKSAHEFLIAQLSKLQFMPQALRVVEIMVRNNYGADASSFYPMLNALTRKKAMDKAWELVEFMRVCEIKPDLTAYNYILTGYCFAGDLKPAAGVLTKMEEEGMDPDSRTYDALVLGACTAGKVDGALMVLRRMADDRVPGLYSTHAHVIGALLRSGYYAQAVEFVMSFAGKDRGVDTNNFRILGHRLINLKRFDEAKLVMEEMAKMGLDMNGMQDVYELHVAKE